MKRNDEIRAARNFCVSFETPDGGVGEVYFPKWRGSVIWSFGGGWDHVSVAPYKHSHTPTWDEMCRIKDIFFNENETVVQYHPAKSDYVNNMPNCLHLWRPQDQPMPVPPPIMVGIKKGMSNAEIRAEISAVLEEKHEEKKRQE